MKRILAMFVTLAASVVLLGCAGQQARAVPAGTRAATRAEAEGKAALGLEADRNLVDRHATYVVPLGLTQAASWFTAHPPAGLTGTERSTEKGRDGVGSIGLGFTGASTKAYESLEEEVMIYPLDNTHAIARIDGVAIWLPSTDVAPTDVTAVRITRVARAGAAPHNYRLTGVAARRLAEAVNRQRAYTDGSMNCPNDNGGYDILHFTAPDGDRSFRVETSGCGLITRTDGGARRPVLISIDLVPTLDRAVAATKH